MMRASVLIMLAPLVLAAAACRDNPGFILDSAGDDRDGTSSGTSAETTAGSTTEAAAECEPVATVERTDVCEWAAVVPDTPNLVKNSSLLLADEGCGTDNEFFIERRGTEFHRCAAADCGGGCDPLLSVDISGLPPLYANLFPEGEGACARLWHHSELRSGGCESTAYAMFDPDDRLRFAAVRATKHAEIDPFGALLDLDVSALEKSATCEPDSSTDDHCPSEATGFKIDFRYGRCAIDDALQGSAWTDLVVDDVTYKLNLYAAFNCLEGGIAAYVWLLHS
jgi:hypothetical protein